LKFGLVVANTPNLVVNDYKSHVIVHGMVTFWLISTNGFMFSIIHKNIYFSSELYVHLLCAFFLVLDYDEMNCNLEKTPPSHV